MSFGGPTKYCPRCNSLLPADAPVCGTCGLQFSAPSGPSYGATQYGGPGAQGGWQQGQPGYSGYAPQGQAGYGYVPQGQPAYPGYPAPPVAAPPRKNNTGLILAIVVVLVVVGGGTAAWFLYLNPARCSGPLFDRHGQPSSIPMPSGCMYNTMRTATTSGVTADYWFWTVDSPNTPTALHSFYTQNLSGNGWTQKEDKDVGEGIQELGYCGNGLALVIDLATRLQASSNSVIGALDITAPSSGSVLVVGTVSDAKEVAAACG